MILLGTDEIPLTTEEWTSALHQGLKHIISENESIRVFVDNETNSDSTLLNIVVEVHGGNVDASTLKKTASLNKLSNGPGIKKINLMLSSVSVDDIPAFLEVDGKNLDSEILRDSQGRLWLAPCGINTDSRCDFLGKVQITSLKNFIEKKAFELAKKNGAALTRIDVRFKSMSDKQVEVMANLEGRKFGMSAGLIASGKLEIDSNCDLIISDLEVSGNGGMGSMVAGLLSPEINKWSGKKIAISQYVLNGLSVTDAKVSVDNNITISAVARFTS